MEDTVIFLNVDLECLLILVNILDLLTTNCLKVIIYPIGKIEDILKFFKNNYSRQKVFRILLITKKVQSEVKKNLVKENLSEILNLNFTEIRTDKFLKKILANFDFKQFCPKENFMKIYTIDSTTFSKKCVKKPLIFFKKLSLNIVRIPNFKENIWFNTVFLWYLYFTKKTPTQSALLRIKKMSKMVFHFLKKQVKKEKEINNPDLSFFQELPLYFLNHSTILNSFLNTPFMVMIFGLWKDKGFVNILQFLGKINIFPKDFQKSWTMFNRRKKKIILKDFEVQIKKFNPTLGIICVIKNKIKNSYIKPEISNFDMALIIRSIFDQKIHNLLTPLSKKKFFSGINCLYQTKTLKKYVERERKIQEFISRMGRMVLLKKAFLSRKRNRILYLTGSTHISYRMAEGLLMFLISAFNKNKMRKKLFLLIIKENVNNTMFISHQNKNISFVYQKIAFSHQVKNKIYVVEEKKNLVVIKFPKDYEFQILTLLSQVI
jgi:hypothetical protein